METSDLNLSNHQDISILYRILKLSSQQKLNFASIQSALKTLLKSKEISQLDKYLNFFMVIKSNLKDDSSIAWNQLFHIEIRKLQREILGAVTYQKRLVKKLFIRWREQLSMRIIENYIVPDVPEQQEELVDPSIKLKARVFHSWMVYCQRKIVKRDKKQEEQSEIARVGKQFQASKVRECLRDWREKFRINKEREEMKSEIVEGIEVGRKSRVLGVLREGVERREIVEGVRERIKGCVVKIQKHSVFEKLNGNMQGITKPKPLNSYYGLIFLKHLIQRGYNNRKQLDYSNLHSVIKFKSKARREIFKDQMGTFYRIIKQKSFQSWKLVIQEREQLFQRTLQFIKRNILLSLKQRSTQHLVIKNKTKVFSRIVFKRYFKGFRSKIQTLQSSRNQFKAIQSAASAEIHPILKHSYFLQLKQIIHFTKQQHQKQLGLDQLLSTCKVRYGLKLLQKAVSLSKVQAEVPLMYQSRLMKKYFKNWVRFIQQRDTNMVGIYRFQIDYSRRVKSVYLLRLKHFIESKKETHHQQQLIRDTIKANSLNLFYNNCHHFINTKPDSQRQECLRKTIYLKRFCSRTRGGIAKKQEYSGHCTQILQTITKTKIFNILKKNRVQIQQNTVRVQDGRQYLVKKSTLQHLFGQVQYSNRVSVLEQARYQRAVGCLFSALKGVHTENQVVDQRIHTLHNQLAKNRARISFNTLSINHLLKQQVRDKQSQCTSIRVRNCLKVIKDKKIEMREWKQRREEKYLTLVAVLEKKVLRDFAGRSRVYLSECAEIESLGKRSKQLGQHLSRTRVSGYLEFLRIQCKQRCLSSKIMNRGVGEWRLFYKELKREVKIGKLNGVKTQKFRIKRNKRVLKETLKSLLRELNRRGEALNTISSLVRKKEIETLRHSMAGIFDEYRVCFKLNACQQIRKRFALEHILNNHLSSQTIKLQDYKAVKHYASTLLNKVFKAFTLSIYKSVNDQNSVLKTVAKANFLRQVRFN